MNDGSSEKPYPERGYFGTVELRRPRSPTTKTGRFAFRKTLSEKPAPKRRSKRGRFLPPVMIRPTSSFSPRRMTSFSGFPSL